MDKNQTEARQICEEYGLRKTKTRLFLFSALQSMNRPVAIPELLEIFEKEDFCINKTTLYREVECLVQRDVLRAVQLSPRKISYEFVSHGHHHHFVCTSCDFITDVKFPEASIEKTEKLLREQGATITHHSLEFFGLCKTCN